ncbi:MAG: hypothetical protein JWO81_2177 [Alphaproteobacteria bacterium]|nr:hypothetical protein [Alphaproteobacteria bacterium]
MAAVPENLPQAASPFDHVIVADASREVAIRYDFTPTGVEFSGHLPAGWSFSVEIDGDQDGRWGMGPETGAPHVQITPDRSFGQDSRNGVFCSQYIFSSYPQDPSDVYASSECGGLPSKGVVEMTGFDAGMRATIRLKIPYEEVFGNRPDAHLTVCIWDTHRRNCQYSPAKPFVLRRPARP